MWRDHHQPRSIAELLHEAWLQRTTSLSLIREMGPMHWSADVSQFYAWEDPTFFVTLLTLREPRAPLARVELLMEASLGAQDQQIGLTIIPPLNAAGDSAVKRLWFKLTPENQQAQIERAVETIVLVFRCVRQHWSWAEFQARFQESIIHAHHHCGAVFGPA